MNRGLWRASMWPGACRRDQPPRRWHRMPAHCGCFNEARRVSPGSAGPYTTSTATTTRLLQCGPARFAGISQEPGKEVLHLSSLQCGPTRFAGIRSNWKRSPSSNSSMLQCGPARVAGIRATSRFRIPAHKIASMRPGAESPGSDPYRRNRRGCQFASMWPSADRRDQLYPNRDLSWPSRFNEARRYSPGSVNMVPM